MKANALEKIYISTNSQDGTYYISNQYKRLIEYTRTDAFIEKAAEFLSKEGNIPLWEDRGGNFGCDIALLIKNFKNHMKGE